MKILRKRVGSLKIEDKDINNIVISNDSILLNEKIIFNFLPIKNLSFFSLKIEKSNIESKYWIFLDLNLNDLYKDLINGKIITSRDLIFDMIISSLNRLKINNKILQQLDIKEYSYLQNILDDNNFKLDNVYCFEKKFVKYGKVYFDIDRKLITVDKCKKTRIKVPSIIIIKNYYQIFSSIKNILLDTNVSDSIFIISSKDSDLVYSKLFNLYPNNNDNLKKTIVFSEDLNFQMENYLKEIGNNDFLEQLEFESNSFFYSKKNIFILANNLNQVSINYLSFCNFEKIFLLNFKEIYLNNYNILSKLVYKYDNYRISKIDGDNNMILSNYILSKRTFILNTDNTEVKYHNIKIKNFPYDYWKSISDKHFISLESNNQLVSKFVKIGISNDWSSTYLEKLHQSINPPSDNKCPISLSNLDSFSVITECTHCFNLKNIVKWMEKSDECPICRCKIDINKVKFLKTPDFSILSKNLEKKNWLIVTDKLWYEKLHNDKINIMQQLDFINNINEVLTKGNKKIINILNLSGLTDEDILYLGHNSGTNIQFINLVSDD